MSTIESMGVKTVEGWHKYAESHPEASQFNNYCKPGDFVDESVYDYFLDILPPRTMTRSLLQVGEPASTKRNRKNGKYQSTYSTFQYVGKVEGERVWEYRGNCFVGEAEDVDVYRKYSGIAEFLKATYHERSAFGLEVVQTQRPPVICNDGFEMSVQASNEHYCYPRQNREDGKYKTCEVGFPSAAEELLLPYAESPKKPTKTVYSNVPVEVIDQVIEKHGGYFDARIPVV